MKARAALLGILVLALAFFGLRGLQEARRTMPISALCDASASGDASGLEDTADPPAGPARRTAAPCRCRLHFTAARTTPG